MPTAKKTAPKPQSGAPSRRWLSLAEAGEHLGVTERTVRNYVSAGRLPAHRIRGSRLVRVDTSDVDALMQRIPAVRGTVA